MATRTLTLEELEIPGWFDNAAFELKAVRPRWAKNLPAIDLRSGEALPEEASGWIVAALRESEKEAATHDLVSDVKRYARPESLDAWMAAVLRGWLAAKCPEKDTWILSASGHLGGDLVVQELQGAVRTWTREKKRALAVMGTDAMGRIGSVAALQELAVMSVGGRDRGVTEEAQYALEKKAQSQGIVVDPLDSLLASTFGLDARAEREFDFGPRKFRAVLGTNLEFRLYDESGKLRPRMPAGAKSDDAELAAQAREQWSEMKAGVRRTLKAVIKHLEQAMITGRIWTWDEISGKLLANPIAAMVARQVVWQAQSADDGWTTLRFAEDLAPSDVEDDPVELDTNQKLRVPHPLVLKQEELTAWGTLLGDYELVQPFPQLQREIFHCLPQNAEKDRFIAPTHPPLKPGVLYGILDNDGWTLSRSLGDFYTASWKYFRTEDVTAAIAYSGLQVGNIGTSPEQSLKACWFHKGEVRQVGERTSTPRIPLGSVPDLPYSETVRRLTRLTQEP